MSASQFEGSFSEGVERDHEGHLVAGSFGNFDCPKCRDAVTQHLDHERRESGSFGGQVPADAEGHPLQQGSFGAIDCPVCRAFNRA